MATKKQKNKWDIFVKKNKLLLYNGLLTGEVKPYDDELIRKLRNIYDGGLPASLLLLCRGMSSGHCFDRALLMARAFLDTDDDVNLIYASVDTVRLNPLYIDSKNPSYSEHCFVERITTNGEHLIYDTSAGLVYDKSLYWKMENPKVREVKNKRAIIEMVKSCEEDYPEDIESAKDSALIYIPLFEIRCYSQEEPYANRLKKEIDIFKKVIDYDRLAKETDDEIMGLKTNKKSIFDKK